MEAQKRKNERKPQAKQKEEQPSSLPLVTVEANEEEDRSGISRRAARGCDVAPEKKPEGAALWRKTRNWQ